MVFIKEWGERKKGNVAQETQAKQQSKTIDMMAETQNIKFRVRQIDDGSR